MRKLLIALAVAATVLAYPAAYYNSEEQVTFTVTGKERMEDGFYLIYTDIGTLKIQDLLLSWRFDGSDLYGALEIDQQYHGTTMGWRWGLASIYPDLVRVEGL